MPNDEIVLRDIPYVAPLLGNIRQILTGLQGFDAMAREIIQNADDAGANRIRFSIEQDCLKIWNDELFLSCGLTQPKCPWELEAPSSDRPRKACDFHAISTVGSGNKYRDPALIGRFGIGFVSVYQVTDTPIVRSLGVQVELDPLRESNRVTAIYDIKGSEFELPWAFNANSPIREALDASAITREDLDAVQRDVSSVADDCLLFLRNLASIEIVRDGKVVKRVVRDSVASQRVRLSFFPEERKEEWYLIHADAAKEAAPLREKYPAIERLARQTEIQIAFKLDGPEGNYGRLFAYLPTEQPSPVPCHINADFFPEQNRKALVLSGEQHERHWNEMLLGVAANEISKHLLQLRDVLGSAALWRLIGKAFDQKDSAHFGAFWTALDATARTTEIAWSATEKWLRPEKCRLAAREMEEAEERALAHIGLDLVHKSLRPFQNVLQVLGARRLTLPSIVDALENWDKSSRDDDASKGNDTLYKLVQPLWAVTDALARPDLPPSEGVREALPRLQRIRFVPAADGALVRLSDLYKLPSAITQSQLFAHMPDLPIVSESFQQFANLYSCLDLLSFEQLLAEIAALIPDEPAAKKFFGSAPKTIREFYRFLSGYPRPSGNVDVSSVAGVPLLAGHHRFLTPAEAVLPGGFKDPVGRFNTLDSSYYDDRTQEFLRDVLNVRVLTLDSYIRYHLSDILKSGISVEEYVALFDQLTAHSDLLANDEILAILSRLPIARTMDATMRRPGECYFRSPELAELLGDQKALWVDTSVFGPFQSEVAKAFLSRLGMRSRPSLTHALDRIDVIVAHPPSESRQNAIANLLQFVFEVFDDDSLADRESEFAEEITRLRSTNWLPATQIGELQTDTWYAPNEMYQPFRAPGFDSQVPVLAIRQNSKKPLTGQFLAFLGMPAEPRTSTVVNHLAHCTRNGSQPSELTYQILNERLKAEDDVASIERLRGQSCIYSTTQKRYLGADRVFWSKPPIRQYCFQAPDWMHRHKELFDFLGVREEPEASTYSGILKDIAKDFGGQAGRIPSAIQLIHEICLKTLATEVRERPATAHQLLDELVLHPFLITVAGTLAFAHEVAIKDSNWLAEAFGDELDSRLVQPLPEFGVLFERLRLKSLSEVTHLEAVRLGEEIPDEEASERLAERRHLLMWLFSELRGDARKHIHDSLSAVQIARSDFIQVRAVFKLIGPAVVSTPTSELVLFEKEKRKLYLHLDLGTAYWIPALRGMFSTLLAGHDGVDVRQCALNASHVLLASSSESAQLELEQAGFSAPSAHNSDHAELPADDLGDISDGSNQHAGLADQPYSKPLAAVEDDNESKNAPPSKKDGSSSGESPKPAPPTSGHHVDSGNAVTEGQSEGGAPDDSRRGRSEGKDAGSATPGPSTARTQWMRSYVVPHTESKTTEASDTEEQQDRNAAIDEAAMNEAIEYEVMRRCVVERMPHFNPGYDILSRSSATGERRIIEVKGLNSEWTGRGVKLSRTQIMNAEEYGDEYWLYVVEHALDAKNRKLHAIQNPFFKADEFWFDYVWRDVASEHGGGLLARLIPGRKIKVEDWGIGKIIGVQQRGAAVSLTIEFPIHGKRNLAFNNSRMELIED